MYPVSNEILQAALEHIYPEDKKRWDVDDGTIILLYEGKGGFILYSNGEFRGHNAYPKRVKTLENLLKPRNDWPDNMCEDIISDAREHTGLGSYYRNVSIATTGKAYVLSCKFYDKAMELHVAEQEPEPKPEHKLPVDPEILQDALNEGPCHGYWKVSYGIISYNDGIVWDDTTGMTIGYDSVRTGFLSKLLNVPEWSGISQLEISKRDEIIAAAKDLTGYEKYSWATGEEYYKYATYRHEVVRLVEEHNKENLKETIRELKEDVEQKHWTPMTSEQLQKEIVPYTDEMKEKYGEGVYIGPSCVPTADGGGMLVASDGTSQELTEQEYRARTAGYAHVQPDETDHEENERARHESRLEAIKEDHNIRRTYAHFAPKPVLSGCRIENGWLVAGYAVTDGSQYGPIEGETTGDKDGCGW